MYMLYAVDEILVHGRLHSTSIRDCELKRVSACLLLIRYLGFSDKEALFLAVEMLIHANDYCIITTVIPLDDPHHGDVNGLSTHCRDVRYRAMQS